MTSKICAVCNNAYQSLDNKSHHLGLPKCNFQVFWNQASRHRKRFHKCNASLICGFDRKRSVNVIRLLFSKNVIKAMVIVFIITYQNVSTNHSTIYNFSAIMAQTLLHLPKWINKKVIPLKKYECQLSYGLWRFYFQNAEDFLITYFQLQETFPDP